MKFNQYDFCFTRSEYLLNHVSVYHFLGTNSHRLYRLMIVGLKTQNYHTYWPGRQRDRCRNCGNGHQFFYL